TRILDPNALDLIGGRLSGTLCGHARFTACACAAEIPVRVLFDLNVLIDVACRWQSFPDSLTLYQHITASPTDEGAFAGCGYTTLYYIMNQMISEARTRAVLVHFCTQLTLIPLTLDIATTARSEEHTSELQSRGQ